MFNAHDPKDPKNPKDATKNVKQPTDLHFLNIQNDLIISNLPPRENSNSNKKNEDDKEAPKTHKIVINGYIGSRVTVISSGSIEAPYSTVGKQCKLFGDKNEVSDVLPGTIITGSSVNANVVHNDVEINASTIEVLAIHKGAKVNAKYSLEAVDVLGGIINGNLIIISGKLHKGTIVNGIKINEDHEKVTIRLKDGKNVITKLEQKPLTIEVPPTPTSGMHLQIPSVEHGSQPHHNSITPVSRTPSQHSEKFELSPLLLAFINEGNEDDKEKHHRKLPSFPSSSEGGETLMNSVRQRSASTPRGGIYIAPPIQPYSSLSSSTPKAANRGDHGESTISSNQDLSTSSLTTNALLADNKIKPSFCTYLMRLCGKFFNVIHKVAENYIAVRG